MAATETVVVRLSDLVDGQEGVFYALLVEKKRGMTKRNQPYYRCLFRDKRGHVEAPLWADHPFHAEADRWVEGMAYRLRARAELKLPYGLQIDIAEIRPAADDDEDFNWSDLVEGAEQDPEDLFRKLHDLISRGIDDPYLRRLVGDILGANASLFKKMPAAQNFHHSYTSGLLEHVWSMTRIASFLADHYGKYYHQLNPPLNKGVILAATVLHDIGKLRELQYHPMEARYTKEGCLIGHVLMGRDMVREAARQIDGFPEETLMLLEHAILSHHGKREFGAPILPQTLEALLVSYVDDLDAKMNIAARGRLLSNTDGEFTDKVFALDNRRFYKGIPEENPDGDDYHELTHGPGDRLG